MYQYPAFVDNAIGRTSRCRISRLDPKYENVRKSECEIAAVIIFRSSELLESFGEIAGRSTWSAAIPIELSFRIALCAASAKAAPSHA